MLAFQASDKKQTPVMLVLIWQILGMCDALPNITANCGQLTVRGYDTCEITHNDQVVHYVGPEKEAVPGLRFGLITYKCDHGSGYLFSDLDCAKCDFECSEEKQVESSSSNCGHDSVQFWLGAILGFCFAGLIVSFVIGCLCETIEGSSWFQRLFPRQKYADDTCINVSDEADLRDGDEEQTSDRNSSQDSTSELPGKPRLAGSSRKRTLLALFTSLLLIKSTRACDVILVMEANNIIMSYENGKWSGHPPYFTVQVGQEICIEDRIGDRVSLLVSEIVFRRRYEVVYYTCDYDSGDITTVSSSCIYGESCGEFKECYNHTLAKLTDEQSEDKNPYWYCEYKMTSSRSFGKFPLSQKPVGCITVQKKERKGELYPVYKKLGETGTIKLTVNGTLGFQEITLSNYEPYHQLTRFRLQEVDRVPITLASIWSDRSLDFLLRFDDKFYYVSAAELNDPRTNLFGDFQISLDKKTKKYAPLPGVTCEVSDYECGNCSAPQTDSMISKLVMDKLNLGQPKDFLMLKTNSSIIHTFETETFGTASLRVGNWTLSDSTVQRAKCDVNFVASYGCASCNESAYVVLRSDNIEKEGLIPFRSNCSFDRQFVKCDFEPTKLVLKKSDTTCNIRLPTLRKNILINVTYFNFGHQVKRKREQNCTVVYTSYGEALEHLVTSDRFIGTFVKSTILFLVFNFIMIACVFISSRNQSRSERRTELVDL